MASVQQNAARRMRRAATTDRSPSDRLREAFPEIDFKKIVERGAFNQHNLDEKWEALGRQVQWWIDLSNGLN